MTSPDVQDRLQNALGSAYTIGRELGGGGMSRVFVADEATLGRKVVVKVLRPELAEGLSAERFKREVKLAAQLQHPHVVPLLAAGELEGGVVYYTMPFVEGESLRARLDHGGAMPIAEIVRILRDAASALAYAHGRGIVHRDIKPDNVLLSHGGAVVADFGIAKAISAASDTPRPDGATHASTLTAAGTSLGTPAYMAPEQAAGDVVDYRADLYALGVVAYEMLCGRPPFEGRTAQQLLAAHATQAPEQIERRRASVPGGLSALVMQLLEKHPADRPQSADEVIVALDGVAGALGTTTRSGPSIRRRVRGARQVVPWIALGVIAIFGGIALGWTFAARRVRPNVEARPIVAMLGAPAGYELRPEKSYALSPDGSKLAFVAADPRGATAIWVQPLDELSAFRIENTDDAEAPFWSPDGSSLGFFAKGNLHVIDRRNGVRRTLCPAVRPGGGTWSPSGVIVYSPDLLAAPLYQVPAAGGVCTKLTRPRPDDFDHRRPSALPDSQHVLFSSSRTNSSVVADLSTGAVSTVRDNGSEAQFAPPNWLLYRDLWGPKGPTGPILAQRLDMRTLKPLGEPRVVFDQVLGFGLYSRFSATERAFVAVRPSSQPVVWVDRQSKITESIPVPSEAGPRVNNANIDVSHDGRLIAFGGSGLWVYSRDRKAPTKLPNVLAMPGQQTMDPSWSPGDSMLAYITVLRGPIELRRYNIHSGTSETLVSLGKRGLEAPDWSPDGGRILFQVIPGEVETHNQIWMYTFATRSSHRLFEEAANTISPRWSPDGRYLAYVSDESGVREVYVRPIAGGARTQISTTGGEVPRWRADGKELFYRAPDGTIMGVTMAPGNAAAPPEPRVVVASPPFSNAPVSLAVSPDATRFIAYARGEPAMFTLLLDWAAKLK